MIKDILTTIEEQASHKQGTPSWHRDRLGCITSSNISLLMMPSAEEKAYQKALANPPKVKFPKGATEEEKKAIEKAVFAEYEQTLAQLKQEAKDNPFSDSCKSYLCKVAAERNLQPRWISDEPVLDENGNMVYEYGSMEPKTMFDCYLERVNISTKAMRYGTENEAIAREIYKFYEKVEVDEFGFIRHTTIPNYGDSPDGVVFESPERIVVVEIKFPQPDTFIRYARDIHSMEDLKEVKPEYYWQCMSHIEVAARYFRAIGKLKKRGRVVCDFVFCDKMQKGGYKKIHFYPKKSQMRFMTNRVRMANKYIDELLKIIK